MGMLVCASASRRRETLAPWLLARCRLMVCILRLGRHRCFIVFVISVETEDPTPMACAGIVGRALANTI